MISGKLISGKLDLAEFRVFNVERSLASKDVGGFGHALDAWTPAEWGNALAGETGEFCNLLKKIRRGENIDMLRVADEAGDILAYLDLATAAVNISLAQAVVRKWDRVSMEKNYDRLLSSRMYR